MDFDEIFTEYYTLYRAESDIPVAADDEYIIALPLANEAIRRWSNYDNTMWKELYQTLQGADDGDNVIVASTTEYAAPTNMKLAGGDVIVLDTNGTRLATYPIVNPEDTQFMNDTVKYAYFVGNPNTGFTLNINPVPESTLVGKSINYLYYSTPTKMTKGTSKPEMADPYFIVHRMLANRFRASRNPYYTTAKTEAEDSLRTMQLQNNSGSWGNPWSVPDRSGSTWGG